MSSAEPITVHVAPLEAAFDLYRSIPEFSDAPIDFDRFQQRLSLPSALVLVARAGASAVGFKAGYDRYRDGSWYSWLGGVLTEHRAAGVARTLLTHQEEWVRERGYARIFVKTRNRFVGMRILLDRSGYHVCGVEVSPGEVAIEGLRLLYVKSL